MRESLKYYEKDFLFEDEVFRKQPVTLECLAEIEETTSLEAEHQGVYLEHISYEVLDIHDYTITDQLGEELESLEPSEEEEILDLLKSRIVSSLQ